MERPDRIASTMRRIWSGPGRPDAIVVAGGDGTVNAAAGAAAGTDLVLGVLPLGTFNHFAKDLGIPTDLHEAAAALAERRERAGRRGRGQRPGLREQLGASGCTRRWWPSATSCARSGGGGRCAPCRWRPGAWPARSPSTAWCSAPAMRRRRSGRRPAAAHPARVRGQRVLRRRARRDPPPGPRSTAVTSRCWWPGSCRLVGARAGRPQRPGGTPRGGAGPGAPGPRSTSASRVGRAGSGWRSTARSAGSTSPAVPQPPGCAPGAGGAGTVT